MRCTFTSSTVSIQNESHAKDEQLRCLHQLISQYEQSLTEKDRGKTIHQCFPSNHSVTARSCSATRTTTTHARNQPIVSISTTGQMYGTNLWPLVPRDNSPWFCFSGTLRRRTTHDGKWSELCLDFGHLSLVEKSLWRKVSHRSFSHPYLLSIRFSWIMVFCRNETTRWPTRRRNSILNVVTMKM